MENQELQKIKVGKSQEKEGGQRPGVVVQEGRQAKNPFETSLRELFRPRNADRQANSESITNL
jgi:hypothetical protein